MVQLVQFIPLSMYICTGSRFSLKELYLFTELFHKDLEKKHTHTHHASSHPPVTLSLTYVNIHIYQSNVH